MKKYLMMFAAIITLAAMSMSFVSCGSDDDEPASKYKTYTMTTEVDPGSLDATFAAQLKQLESSNSGEYESDEAAIAVYQQIVEKGTDYIQSAMQMIALASGKKDFVVYVKLYNENKKQLKSTKFSFDE